MNVEIDLTKEIATEAIGMSEDSMKSRMKECVQKMAELPSDEGITISTASIMQCMQEFHTDAELLFLASQYYGKLLQ